MTFIDGTCTHELLAHDTPSDEAVRNVAKALIGVAVTAGPTTDTDRLNARIIAEAVGLAPTTYAADATIRDAVTGSRRKRTSS